MCLCCCFYYQECRTSCKTQINHSSYNLAAEESYGYGNGHDSTRKGYRNDTVMLMHMYDLTGYTENYEMTQNSGGKVKEELQTPCSYPTELDTVFDRRTFKTFFGLLLC